MHPPRKRKSMGSGNGARADARYSARGGVRITTRVERTKKSQTTTHAERAKSIALRLEIGSSGAVYSQTCLLPHLAIESLRKAIRLYTWVQSVLPLKERLCECGFRGGVITISRKRSISHPRERSVSG